MTHEFNTQRAAGREPDRQADSAMRLCLKLAGKKQQLLALVERLIRFKQHWGFDFKIIGSVANLSYWLDSDLDVYYTAPHRTQAWFAWCDWEEAEPWVDGILYPDSGFKQTIEQTGLSPEEVKRLLEAFEDYDQLVSGFSAQRLEKINRTLSNSQYSKKALQKHLEMLERWCSGADTDDMPSAYMIQSQLRLPIQKLVFRFVWVVALILSRFDALENPMYAPELEHDLPLDTWQAWVAQLAQPTANRPAFIVPYADQIADFYAWDEMDWLVDHKETEATELLMQGHQWLAHYDVFEAYTQAWLKQHWVNH